MIHICLRQPRQVVQTEPTRKVEKKEEKKGRLWTTNANRLQITVNLKKIHHLRRAFRRFCASSHPSYKCFMLENLAFFHNSSKTPDNADIANRKHYSAPAGALTLFFPQFFSEDFTHHFTQTLLILDFQAKSQGANKGQNSFGGREMYSLKHQNLCQDKDEKPVSYQEFVS